MTDKIYGCWKSTNIMFACSTVVACYKERWFLTLYLLYGKPIDIIILKSEPEAVSNLHLKVIFLYANTLLNCTLYEITKYHVEI